MDTDKSCLLFVVRCLLLGIDAGAATQQTTNNRPRSIWSVEDLRGLGRCYIYELVALAPAAEGLRRLQLLDAELDRRRRVGVLHVARGGKSLAPAAIEPRQPVQSHRQRPGIRNPRGCQLHPMDPCGRQSISQAALKYRISDQICDVPNVPPSKNGTFWDILGHLRCSKFDTFWCFLC